MSSIPRPSDRLSFESKTFFSTVCSSTGTTLSSGPLTRFLSIVNQTKGGIGWSKKLLKATFLHFLPFERSHVELVFGWEGKSGDGWQLKLPLLLCWSVNDGPCYRWFTRGRSLHTQVSYCLFFLLLMACRGSSLSLQTMTRS